MFVFADILEERSVPYPGCIPEGWSLQDCVVWTYGDSFRRFILSVDQLIVHVVIV